MLTDYAQNVGLAMRGIRVSICEKWHCKKIRKCVFGVSV
jgi:hypothetical protein